MNFDFYQQYSTYSNIELLKIVKRPADYQPAAIAVATQILNEREVSPEEIRLVDDYYRNIDNSIKTRSEKIGALKNKAVDLFEPVLYPSEKVEPNKWVNILLFAISIQYAWTLFNIIKALINFFQCHYCRWSLGSYLGLFMLLYIPIIFFLLFRRMQWGWILLFADNLFSLILRLSESYIFFKYQSIHHGDTASFVLPIFIRTAFVFFLWREPIANHFAVNADTKKNTALITIGVALVFLFVMYLIFSSYT